MVSSCQYYVLRKKRYCRMTVKEGNSFCGEHSDKESNSQDRIACPYDSNHSCSQVKMAKHLKVCVSRPLPLPSYVCSGLNSGAKEVQTISHVSYETLSIVSNEKLMNVIERIQKVYSTIKSGIKEKILYHEILKDELKKEHYGFKVIKHLKQNSSLLGHLREAQLLNLNNVSYVEFGSGRGQLSYWLTQSNTNSTNVVYLLVDKASTRHKLDNKLQYDDKLTIQRIRVDIENLDLKKVSQLEAKQIIGISKHLCGCATDYSLRCLKGTQLKGLCIALCCHHRCDWTSYVGKKFLIEEGFLPQDFQLLCGLTSWATCGTGRPRNDDKQSNGVSNRDRYETLDLSREKREEIGRATKRLLDYGRLCYVQESFELKAELVYYIETIYSLENVLLIAS